MTEPKGFGSKILGIFVESDGTAPDGAAAEEGDKSPAELVAELARSSSGKGAGSKSPSSTGQPIRGSAAADAGLPPNLKLDRAVAGVGNKVPSDFDSIFRDAGMDASELDRVKKAEELLKSLPDATPQPVKKQIVEASLKAFGFEVDKIVQAAHNQQRALDAYVRVNETATAKAISDAETEIQSLNQRITALRADIERRTATLSAVATAAQGRKGDVQKVLEFFQGPEGQGPSGSSTP